MMMMLSSISDSVSIIALKGIGNTVEAFSLHYTVM